MTQLTKPSHLVDKTILQIYIEQSVGFASDSHCLCRLSDVSLFYRLLTCIRPGLVKKINRLPTPVAALVRTILHQTIMSHAYLTFLSIYFSSLHLDSKLHTLIDIIIISAYLSAIKTVCREWQTIQQCWGCNRAATVQIIYALVCKLHYICHHLALPFHPLHSLHSRKSQK